MKNTIHFYKKIFVTGTDLSAFIVAGPGC